MCRMTPLWLIIFLLFISPSMMAQPAAEKSKWNVIAPYPIDITWNKTSNLIFPYPVISVDRGTSNVLVQKAKHVGNILQLKASGKNADTTNLSVVTSDGKFYSFLVAYNDNPTHLNLMFQNDSVSKTEALPIGENEAMIREGISMVQRAKPFMQKAIREQGIGLKLCGIYLYHDICFFKVAINNQSAFKFDLENVRLNIKDKHKAKRSASQEKEIPILASSKEVVEGNAKGVLVIPTRVFSIAPKQRLLITLLEKDEGRSIHLTIDASRLLKVHAIK